MKEGKVIFRDVATIAMIALALWLISVLARFAYS